MTQLAEPVSKRRSFITTFLLVCLNLVNFMDRFTLAANLIDIQNFYNIDDSLGGLLQTSFVVSFIIFAPIFGYLGDRYSRKWLMVVGVSIWLATVIACTFVPADHFWLFMLCRGIIGIGEASYATIAPTIIADLFVKDMRSKMLMLFYFALPFGSGLGFIIGGTVAKDLGGWQWGLRTPPAIGAIILLAIVLYFKDVPRGSADVNGVTQVVSNTSFVQDLLAVSRIKSFWFLVFGQVSSSSVSAAMAFWIPSFISYSYLSNGLESNKSTTSLIFGSIVCVAGLSGIIIGGTIAQYWRRFNPRADALTCGISLMLSAPIVFASLNLTRIYISVSFLCVFLAVTFFSMTWAVNSDILMYLVYPTRRSFANAYLILLIHVFGDSSSPYIIGAISDRLMDKRDDPFNHFKSLQLAMFMMPFILVLGSGSYLFLSLFLVSDRKKAEAELADHSEQQKKLKSVVNTTNIPLDHNFKTT